MLPGSFLQEDIMKKTISIICAAVLAASALAACGSGASATTAAQTEPSSAAQSTAESTAAAAAGSSAAETKTGESTAAGTATAAVKTATGKFTVGFDQEFPPMGFVGEDGQYTGFDLELAKEAASRLGLEFVAQPINWDAKDMELETENIDCIWNGFTMQGREDAYIWVGPYMANEQVFVVNGDSDIKSAADLKGKAVEVQKDSSGLAAINDPANADLKNSFAQVTEVADYNTALMDLESGACDAVCMDTIVAGYQITSTKKNFKILDDALSKEDYGIGFKKGNTELADAVKGVLEDMKKDGTLEKISVKWFTKNVITLE